MAGLDIKLRNKKAGQLFAVSKELLDEIRALCHNCTVLRGGKVTGEVDPTKETNASLSRLMIGAEPPQLQHHQAKLGATVLEVQGLSLEKQDQFGMTLKDISFEVRAGEIVGIAGVSGNGQQELMAALSGEDVRAAPDAIRLFGKPIGKHSPRRRRRQGLHFVPEERLGRGAVPMHSLASNTLLTRRETVNAFGWINVGAEKWTVEDGVIHEQRGNPNAVEGIGVSS